MNFFFYIIFYVYLKLHRHKKSKIKAKILSAIFLSSKFKFKLIKYINQTKSQLFQELFVINFLNFKKKSFFIEFGASDGIFCSNTYILEKFFLWDGILAEPSKFWQKKIKKNRKCKVFYGAISTQSKKKINFYENISPGLSSLFCSKKNFVKSYKVNTLSINDLLKKYKSPKNIDYLSIDTEGKEYEIIKSLNFKKYRPKIITIEHNYKSDKKLIENFLIRKNYKTFNKSLTQYDMWFYDKEIKY